MHRKRFVAIVVAFGVMLLVGIGIGTGGTLVWSGKLIANALLEVKRIELAKSSVGALEASKSEPPQTAIWALNRHLALIHEFREIGYAQRELDMEAVMAHARLAKCWDALGNADKWNEHVRLGIEIAQSSDWPSLRRMTTSEKNFMVFANGLDDPAKRPPKDYKWESEAGGGSH